MIFDNNIGYWYFFGVMYLLILTYQDYKRNRIVDDRKNWVMLGITISLISHIDTTLIYKLGLSFFMVFLSFLFPRIKGIGQADYTTFSWVFLGFGIINPYQLIIFLIVLLVLTALFLFMKNVIFKYKPPVQYYGVILITYILNITILKLK